jgi:hypothetical protein
VTARLALWLLVLVYFLPAVIACARRSPRKDRVIAVNALLGWTVVFWLIALREALR